MSVAIRVGGLGVERQLCGLCSGIVQALRCPARLGVMMLGRLGFKFLLHACFFVLSQPINQPTNRRTNTQQTTSTHQSQTINTSASLTSQPASVSNRFKSINQLAAANSHSPQHTEPLANHPSRGSAPHGVQHAGGMWEAIESIRSRVPCQASRQVGQDPTHLSHAPAPSGW